jgi:hypothetical protein
MTQSKLNHYKATNDYNREISPGDPYYLNEFGICPTRIKKFKLKVRTRIVYRIELHYYDRIIFVKFYPKIQENNPDKFKLSGFNLSMTEKRKLINTVSVIVYEEIKKNDNQGYSFSFFGQIYDRDNLKNRKSSVRYSIYRKQVVNLFRSNSFKHTYVDSINFYLLTNGSNEVHDKNLQSIITFFREKPEILFTNMTYATLEEIKKFLLESSVNM